MYVHDLDHPDPKPIVDLLKKKGIWQGQKLERAGPSQVAQPMQPRARDDVLSREEQVVSKSAPANREPGRIMDMMHVLN